MSFRPRWRLADGAECLMGEMHILVSLVAVADLFWHIGRIRISFHGVQDDSYVNAVFPL